MWLLLVSQLNSGLSNILYILDEPTMGLHPKDYTKLMEIINRLKRLNNTVIIVEHAPDIMRNADHMIDIGAGAGVKGGHLYYGGQRFGEKQPCKLWHPARCQVLHRSFFQAGSELQGDSGRGRDPEDHPCHTETDRPLLRSTPATKMECPICKGTKFQKDTLHILYKEKNIAEVLDMSVSVALAFLKATRN